jgi:hypothetical protein
VAKIDVRQPPGVAADAAVATHEAASDPHPTYETSAEAAAKVSAHAAASDPHPTYETSAEAAAKVTAHEAGSDPHTGYQKETEKGAASGYMGLDGFSRGAQAPKLHAADHVTGGTDAFGYTTLSVADVGAGTATVYSNLGTADHTPKGTAIRVDVAVAAQSSSADFKVKVVIGGTTYLVLYANPISVRHGSRSIVVTGLTPGTPVTVTAQYKLMAAGSFSCRPSLSSGADTTDECCDVVVRDI